MIEKKIENLYQELYEEKLNLEQEIQRKEIELNNNKKFVQTLKDSLDEDFESFSPRNIDENKHKEINNLIVGQDVIQEDISILNLKRQSLDKKLEELDIILKDFSKNQVYIDVPSKQDELLSRETSLNSEVDIVIDMIKDSVIPDLSCLIHKVEICNKLSNIDMVRCKLELHEIDKYANLILNNLKKIIEN